MKTAELTGAALDWAVAKADGRELGYRYCVTPVFYWPSGNLATYAPSWDWTQGGPIIEREGITIERFKGGPKWSAFLFQTGDCEIAADTPLIAAMRCYVASKLGDDVDIPEELK